MIASRVAGFVLLTVSSLAAAAVEAAERVETIPTRAGVTQGLYIVDAKGTPWATAILYVGGDGKMALDANGPTELKGNYLLRAAEQLSAAGVALVYPDVPSDRRGGFGNFRTEAEHAEDGRAVIAWARQRLAAPVFLIGTSRGTISVANIGARAEPGSIAGAALTSSLMRASKKANAIDRGQLADIAAPVLVVHHRDDGCNVTPPGDVPQLVDDLKRAPRKDLVWIEGGQPPRSGPCDGRSAHGYFGVERQATAALIDWMKATVAR